jgi:uncharacterized protein YndB with AHSA1/START domain
MKEQHIDVSAHSDATPEQVWSLLADVRTYPEWGQWREAGIQRPGDHEEQGVGAIRRLRIGMRRASIERIVALEPPNRVAYELISGLPIREYRAEVTLTAEPAGGTTIRWQSRFVGRMPGQGAFWRFVLGSFIAKSARRLAAAAVAQPSASPSNEPT